MKKQQLYFDTPATQWTEALPLGNGHLGVMLHGGTKMERLALNDSELWSGRSCYKKNDNFTTLYNRVLENMKAGERLKAQNIVEYELLGDFTQVFLPLGDLEIHFNNSENTQYSRTLDFETAVAYINSSSMRKTCFCSAVDHVAVYHIESDTPLDLSLRFTSQLRHKVVFNNNTAIMYGKAPDNILVDDVYQFTPENNIISYDNPENALDFVAGVVVETDGVCNDKLDIKGCTYATLYFTSMTSYNEKSPKEICVSRLNDAKILGYKALLARHIDDFSNIYNRMNLVLNGVGGEQLSLLFAFGRYLLISCSREGHLPANLQGIWNQDLIPPWWSNYTMNINLQMNYWAAWRANMAECALPLFDFVELLQKTGAKTAALYGKAGFAVHHQSDGWGHSTPVGYRDKHIEGSASFGMWYMSGPWLATQLFDGWKYTQDRSLLERVFKIMVGCDEFLKGILVEKDGIYHTSVSTSPENIYKNANGEQLGICQDSAMDIGILREFYSAYARVAEVLGKDDCANNATHILNHLPNYMIYKGRIAEWDGDFDAVDDGHRHFSMLYGAYPGHHLLPKYHDEALNALRHRFINGSGQTGWSAAWAIALAARLRDQDMAEQATEKLQKDLHPNFFGAHPRNYYPGAETYDKLPDFFQIDANFGLVAGICELLLQDYNGIICPLPIQLQSMLSGTCTGLVINGGHIVDISWEQDTIELTVHARRDDELCIEMLSVICKYNGFKPLGNNLYSINVKNNKSYQIKGKLYIG